MSLDLMDIAVLNSQANSITAAINNANQQNTDALATATLAINAVQKKYNDLIDKYNKLAEDNEWNKASADYLSDVVRDNLDVLPMTREEINNGLNAAREAALAKLRAQ